MHQRFAFSAIFFLFDCLVATAQPTGLLFDSIAYNELERLPTWFGGAGQETLENGEKAETLPFKAILLCSNFVVELCTAHCGKRQWNLV